MRKKLTITIDKEIYEQLHRVLGARKISKFIETLVRPKILRQYLEAGYRAMALDEEREAEAREWAEGTCGTLSA
ncbi:MAG: hypothetical protein L0215_21565 [Gemmataceae bacterium]|nr:hypothetical protein [Gemmataceae bacterium]